MIDRKILINKMVDFTNEKLTELSSTNPLILISRPFISRAINNNINKIDSILKLIQDENGKIDIEGIMSETIDNLLVSNIKKYPDVLGGIEIGNGNIKINIPIINKAVVFNSDDIEYFKQSLINN